MRPHKPFLGMFQTSWQPAFQHADILDSMSQAFQSSLLQNIYLSSSSTSQYWPTEKILYFGVFHTAILATGFWPGNPGQSSRG